MKGFTLIEVIVAVAISLMVTGFILVNYNSFNDTQTLKQAALTLKNNLRFAQSKATTGQKPTSCTQLVGYSVSFTKSVYSIQALCNPEGLVGDVLSSGLPKGVIFSPIPAPVTFTVLSRGTDLTTGLCIILLGSGKNYSFGLQTNGELNDLGLEYNGSCP